MNEAIRMQLSAFADGELPDNEKELLLRRLSQDPEMRRQVAEYFAIGRALRGEVPIRGIETLRDRIATAIGALEPHEGEAPATAADAAAPPGRRLIRPFAGVATAATVALFAIFGLQFMNDVPETAAVVPAVSENGNFSTQPSPDNMLDRFRLMHETEAADSSMRTRFTAIELRQDLAVESEAVAAPEMESPVDADPEDVRQDELSDDSGALAE
jgi:anti-sigma factor RsiW